MIMSDGASIFMQPAKRMYHADAFLLTELVRPRRVQVLAVLGEHAASAVVALMFIDMRVTVAIAEVFIVVVAHELSADDAPTVSRASPLCIAIDMDPSVSMPS